LVLYLYTAANNVTDRRSFFNPHVAKLYSISKNKGGHVRSSYFRESFIWYSIFCSFMLQNISKYFAFKVSWDTQHVMVTCVVTDMWLVLKKITSVLLQQIILNLCCLCLLDHASL